MKKPKLKVDKRAILESFVQHVEKIVFAVVMVCFVLIVYSALGRDTSPKTPDQQDATPDRLATLATTAKQSWEATEPDPGECVLRPYYEIATRSRQKLAEKTFLPPTGAIALSPPLFPPRRKRSEPPVYSVAELRGSAGFGRVPEIAGAEPAAAPAGVLMLQPAGSGYQGQRWVVLTALVPIERQTEAYRESFMSSQLQTVDDEPDYVGYVVQRVVDNNGPIDWSECETFYSGVERDRANEYWPNMLRSTDDLVDAEFVDEALGFPLLPTVDHEWGESVVHEPEIPLKGDIDDRGTPSNDPDPDPWDPFGAAAVDPADARAGMTDHQTEEATIENLLFRFFDLNVEPGTRYRYRVALVLRNPNADVADSFLSSELLERKRQLQQQAAEETAKGNAAAAAELQRKWTYLQSDWSEPSPPILVPRDSRLLAMGVQASGSAEVLLAHWIEESGVEAFTKKSVKPGDVANFPGCKFPEDQRVGGNPRRGDPDPAPDNLLVDDSVPVDYMTETLVLDVAGGQVLPGRDRLREPGAVAILTPEGELVVRQESEDLKECHRLILTAPVDASAGRVDPPEQAGAAGNLERLRGRPMGRQ